MDSVALTGIARMQTISEPDPVLRNENDVLVRVSHMGVCGSDMHYFNTGRIGITEVVYPCVLGHEGSGIVEEIGRGVEGLKKGQRIMIEPAMPCGKCDQCLADRPHTCRNILFLGQPGVQPGLLSEFILMPEHCCFPLPDHMSNEHAVMAEPLSIAIWAADLAPVRKEMNIGILGSGPIGMCVLLYCKYLGVENIFVTDKLDYRLKMAENSGALWTGDPDSSDIVRDILEEAPEGMDIVFDCCGMQEAMEQAIEIMKPGGKIMIVGIPEFENWSIPADVPRRNEIGFQNVRRQNNRLQTAIDLISESKIDVSSLITHRYSFNETGKAFDLVSNYRDGVMKTIVEFPQS